MDSFPFDIKKNVIECSNFEYNSPPLLSVIVITYNQENYIEQCIQSILDQKTNFPFEIILGDDASSDNTRNICHALQKKNPEKIRLFLHHSENKIKDKLGNPTGKFNLMYSISKCEGKYIAICEGDDYWKDPLKLQKQVDFLENNFEYVAVFTDFDKLNNGSGIVKSNFNQERFKIYNDFEIDLVNLFSKNLKFLRTLTSIYKANVLKSFNYFYLYTASDTQWIFHSLQYGKIYYMNFSSGVYRLNDESTSKSKSFEKNQLFLENYVQFLKIISNKFNLSLLDKRYIQKTIWMYKLRRESFNRDFLKLSITVLQLLVNFHWSKNIFRVIKYAFKTNR